MGPDRQPSLSKEADQRFNFSRRARNVQEIPGPAPGDSPPKDVQVDVVKPTILLQRRIPAGQVHLESNRLFHKNLLTHYGEANIVPLRLEGELTTSCTSA